MASTTQTHIAEIAPLSSSATMAPFLVVRTPSGEERFHDLDPDGRELTLGRAEDCDVILDDDGAVSRRHAAVRVQGRVLEAVDLGSTNGTFIGARKLTGPVRLGPGEVLLIGRHVVSLDWRNPAQARAATDLARDLERAAKYVEAQLPRPVTEGPVRLDWAFAPSAKLGGDVFGYHAVDRSTFATYLIDVTGHGVGAAMHSTSILSTLRRQQLAGVDFRDPAAVLTRLNAAFPMDDHDGFCFTIWYGVFDLRTRVLRYGSGGHHPSYLVPPQGPALPLRVRNPILGAMPDYIYGAGEIQVMPGARLHVFSDGCFEITGRDGRDLGLDDFVTLLTATPAGREITASELHATVRAAARPGPLADDVSIMSFTLV